ncbi:MAG: Rad52/Rad22 family DNA repair protein, partial [candidate division NC10 bacterium]
MNRALLEKPFEPGQIRQRKGRNGLLDYVEGHSVIHRLNEALDGAWSFEIVQHEIREEEVVVIGRLSAEGITKMQFGVSQITREKESGLPISLGDDLKAAATDCIKKCATFLGVGLHLYADKPIGGRGPAPRAVVAPATTAPAPQPPATAPVNGSRQGNG